jgi:hypothetical protein
MINLFKNTLFLSICIIAALALPNAFAETAKTTEKPKTAETEVAYYAFITYKPRNGKWDLAKPIKPAELNVGSYRFQIVRISGPDAQLGWIALRGEFKLIKDAVDGGVKIGRQYTLDEYPQVNKPEFSLWSVDDPGKDTWEMVRDKWAQPLITQMDKILEEVGSHGDKNPNFMRFILRKGISEHWKGEDNKKYRLYRLYQVKAYNFFDNEDYRMAFSRFLNPSVDATSKINQQKAWVTEQESFALAKYLGKPDEKHKEFYAFFKTWFNQMSSDAKQIKNINDKIETVQQTVQQVQWLANKARRHADNAQEAVKTAECAGVSTDEINRKRKAANNAVQAALETAKKALIAQKAIEAAKIALKVNNTQKTELEIDKAKKAIKFVQKAFVKAEDEAKNAITTITIESRREFILYILLAFSILLSIITTTWLIIEKRRNRRRIQDNIAPGLADGEVSPQSEISPQSEVSPKGEVSPKPEAPKESPKEILQPSITIHQLKEQLDELSNRLIALEKQKSSS